VTPEFEAWNRAVLAEIQEIGSHRGGFHLMIDAKIPYELGWNPARTARALLGFVIIDRNLLAALANGEPAGNFG
jgi:hypothetical protein